MNDRDQAREELTRVILKVNADWWPLDAEMITGELLAHPDLVRRALGMEPLLEHALTRTALGDRGLWVEPPTEENAQ